MIRNVFKFIFACLLISISSGLLAQNLSNTIQDGEVFSTENGLSSSRITVNFVDSRGYLWLGTIDGLNRFDGYGFHVFKHHPGDSTGISDSYILCIEEDANGNLWIGTNNGLNRFDRRKGIINEIPLNYIDTSIIHSSRIDGILIEDSLNIWLNAENSLDKINLKDYSVMSYPHSVQNVFTAHKVLTSGLIWGVNNTIWLGTSNGLFAFNPDQNSFQHYHNNSDDPNSLNNNKVNAIFQDKNGVLWIGTDKGLNKYDRLQDKFIVYTPYITGEGNSFQVNDIYEDESGKLWLATNGGMAVFNKRNNSFSIYSNIYLNGNLFSLSSQNSIIIDSHKIIWLGGNQGLIKIDLKPKKFELISSDLKSKPRLNEKNVTAVYKDSQENIWVGYFEKGLNLINPFTSELMVFALSNNTVQCFFEDHNKRVWIGSSDGIYIYLPQKKEIITFEEYFQPIPSGNFTGESIHEIMQDSRGNFWIGTSIGLYRFKENIHTVESYHKIYNNTQSVEISNVYSICFDNRKELWIGTDKGILLFNSLTNVFVRPDLGFNKRLGLESSKVYSLLLDNEGIMWMGTNYGLFNINQDRSERNHYTEKTGLLNNSIFKLLEDLESNIWFSSNRGLTKVDKYRNEFINYGLNDGLQSYEFNPGCGSAAYDGELFFGGESGINSFYPDEIQDATVPPKIQISDIEIFGMSEIKHLFIDQETRFIKVRYNESFNLRFIALDFSYPEQNRFIYSMEEEGKKDNWMFIGSEHKLSFSDLSSGEYIFKLKGSTGSGSWNEEGASLKIIVEAPFWKNRIAYFLYIIIAVIFSYLFFQYRTLSLRKSNRVLRENDIVAREVSKQKELLSKRNKDIEDSLNYAYRIQTAMLTTPAEFKKILPESFILYKPKDIVSGDFYWISEIRNRVFVAAIDCTGHGVPGAFMSLIGFELFREIINMQGVNDPGTILTRINDNMQEIFGKKDEFSLRDGMDLAFCVIDKKNMVLNFSGAFNPLYIIRDNNLIEIKGDHFSIGADSEANSLIKKNFASHKLKLNRDDMIYMFSDGFADQFGGPEGKKYKYRRFRHMLLTIHKLPLNKQRQYLNDSIEDWKGNEEQVDDILVIGIKPDF